MDNLDLELLKTIDSNTKQLVRGYYRENHTSLFGKYNNAYYNICEISIYITLSYYTMVEYFSIINEDLIVLSDAQTGIHGKTRVMEI